jgi:hypothetical protein
MPPEKLIDSELPNAQKGMAQIFDRMGGTRRAAADIIPIGYCGGQIRPECGDWA